MAFFDLNIPYTEQNSRNAVTEKSRRLKLTIKALELGYTGIAYNHTITGLMSQTDSCSISLFPLTSILKLSPSILTAVKLHREALDVPLDVAFKQYRRVTVVVETVVQGAVLNSGNPVLKSYDLVAVRPLRQEVFDLACKSYQVDIIAIEFSENRFRLKQPLIKAAIERGVYFELTYSGLVLDPQLRRQMISNAKLLVDWTRGKNIIFSSAAPSVTELSGPYDVANLACLLGFSMERAKASVSKTCRSLLENALRKKKFYKEAIRVELISPTEQINGFDDWLKWDPISSGEGDLHLDDMEKSFAASSKESKTVKAIDFVSIMNELPSHGLHIKDIVYGDNNASNNIGLLTASKADKPTDVYNTPIDLKLHDPPKTYYQTSVTETRLSENGNLEGLTSEPCAMIIEEETKISNVWLSSPEVEQQNMQADVHEAVYEEKLSGEKGSANICNDVPAAGISASFGNKPSTNDSICPPVVASNEVGIKQNKGKMVSSFFDTFLSEEENVKDAADVVMTPVNSSVPLSRGSLNEDIQEEHLTVKDEDISVAPSSTSVTLRSHDELQNIGASTDVHDPLEVASMEFQVELKDDSHIDHSYAQQSSTGRVVRKQGSSRRSVSSVSLPFNRLLKHSQFKKSRKPKTKSTILSLSELIE